MMLNPQELEKLREEIGLEIVNKNAITYEESMPFLIGFFLRVETVVILFLEQKMIGFVSVQTIGLEGLSASMQAKKGE